MLKKGSRAKRALSKALMAPCKRPVTPGCVPWELITLWNPLPGPRLCSGLSVLCGTAGRALWPSAGLC